jgi:hypothetical protein
LQAHFVATVPPFDERPGDQEVPITAHVVNPHAAVKATSSKGKQKAVAGGEEGGGASGAPAAKRSKKTKKTEESDAVRRWKSCES